MNNNVNIFFTCHYYTLLNITLNPRLIIIRLFRYYRNSNEFGIGAVKKKYSTLILYEEDCDIKSKQLEK
jgi:hypothetical protein